MDKRETYKSICQQNYLPIFIQDWYLDTVCGAEHWDYVMIDHDDGIKAVLPYYLRKQAGVRYITMPQLTKYMGPYFLSKPKNLSQSHKWLKAMIGELPDFDIFKQSFHPDFDNWLPFHWGRFYPQNRFTYCLNLNDLEKVYKNINRNLKRNIKSATETLHLVEGIDIDSFYAVAKLSFERQELDFPLDLEFLRHYDAALVQRGNRKIFAAVDKNDVMHSVSYMIYDNKSAYYLISGDDPQYRKSGAGIYLTWKSIEFARKELNIKHFDFLGSMIPNVEAIRRQFGAYQKAYVYVTKYRWPIHRTLDRIKSKFL